MDDASRNAFTPEVQAEIFGKLGFQQQDWRDLGGFESYVFAHREHQQILRLTHISHRRQVDIDAELEFLVFLEDNGASVCAPIELLDGYSIEHAGFVCCLFEMAAGQQVQEADWDESLIESWGRAIGQFHRLSCEFTPLGPPRFDWREDSNLDFRGMIPKEQLAVLAQADQCLTMLQALPQTSDNYGLIHSDAHAGNFFLNNGELKFFDFDDCCYQWFAFDVATILFSGVLQPWMADDQAEREALANWFLPIFLEGYGHEFKVSPFLLEQLPFFMKLREFSLYGVIHSHLDVNNLQDWYPIKFMAGRKERLERGLPYLDLDFGQLL